MKNSIFKKLIIIISSAVLISGVSLLAFWMSTLNAPDDIEEDITIIIGIGDGSGIDLYVKDELDAKGLNFVPKDRLNEDSIGDNNVSSHVFTANVSWAYEEGDDVPPGKTEKGALLAYMAKFTFYNQAGDEIIHNLSVAQELELHQLFKIELGYLDPEGSFTVENGDYLIDPNGTFDNPREFQEIHFRLTFESEPHNKELRELIINKNFVLEVTLEVEKVELVDKP